jgi:GNAT superfamily N-acetyltransferase
VETPPAAAGSLIEVRPLRGAESDRLAARVAESWGSSLIVSRGRAYRLSELTCLLAVDGEQWLGVAAYRLAGDEAELVLLEAFERRRGTGTSLLEAVAQAARGAGCRRLWLVTSNTNLDALRFYQRRGMHLVRVWPGAMDRSRELKPEIPLVGDYDIPLRDELELEMLLSDSAAGQSPER